MNDFITPMNADPIEELRDLSFYLSGMADVAKNPERLNKSAQWMLKASRNICRQGYFGCFGGKECTSDHK